MLNFECGSRLISAYYVPAEDLFSTYKDEILAELIILYFDTTTIVLICNGDEDSIIISQDNESQFKSDNLIEFLYDYKNLTVPWIGVSTNNFGTQDIVLITFDELFPSVIILSAASALSVREIKW
jgi:hypothetical protein